MTDGRGEPYPAQEDSSSFENGEGLGERERAGRDFRLDLEPLLQPISQEKPSGEFLRYEGTYDAIKDARREEDATIPTGVWERTLKRADWQEVFKICRNALRQKTKDLQIAVWLAEALLHLHGFSGFREGLNLILNLCEKFWDDIYPQVVDDQEDRVSAFIWMNEKLAVKLKFVPVTMPQSQDSQPYTYSDWEMVNNLEAQALKNPRLMEKAEGEGRPTRAKYLGSVMFSSRVYYKRQAEYLREVGDLLGGLNGFLDKQCGPMAPSLENVTNISDEIRRLVVRFLNEKKMDTSEPGRPDQEEEAGDVYAATEEGEPGGRPVYLSIRNRAEAYRMLSEAADYLLIHEPHSPTPYLVKRAVLWGHLTLTELLQELIGNEGDLRQILTLLGIRKPERS